MIYKAECYRYEAWPGQACAYFVGYVAIRRMREKAEAILAKAGLELTLGKFHTVLLGSGPMSLQVLDDMVVEWALAAAAAGEGKI